MSGKTGAGPGLLVLSVAALVASLVLFTTTIHTRLPFDVSVAQSKAVALCFMALGVYALLRWWRNR